MSKIFKSIGLIERFANSAYASIGTNRQAQPQQGSTAIQLFNFRPTQGSTTPKPFIIFPFQGSVTLPKYIFQPNRTTPLIINYNFPKQISLKDRVQQTNLGTTKYLPQFFLSDIFTDYIKIKPFGIFNHTSNITIKPFGIFEHTSNTTIQPFGIFEHTSTIYITAFGIFNHTSNIVLTKPIQDVSGFQGIVTLPNGATSTNSFVILSKPSLTVQSPTPQIGLFTFTPNQGSIILNAYNFTPTQGGIPYKAFIFFPTQYNPQTGFKLFTFKPAYETIQIKTARYTADRLLATTLPKVKHGSAEINKPFQPDIDQGSVDLPYDFFQPSKGVDFEPGILFTRVNKNEQEAQRDLLVKGDESNPSSYTTIRTYLNKEYKAITPRYRTADLENIGVIREENEQKGKTARDFREIIGVTDYIDSTPPSEYIDKYGDVDRRKKDNDDTNPDLIDFKITSTRTGTVVQFTAYLTQFGHTFSPTWTDINYVGRQDTLKAFKGVTQGVSLGFTTAAFLKEDMPTMYEKLRNLSIITSIGKPSNDNTYLLGPACKITIGRWFVDTPCIFNSLKYDIETGEYPWDIDRLIQMPQYVKVSLDCVILGDNNGNPLGKPGIEDKIFNYV